MPEFTPSGTRTSTSAPHESLVAHRFHERPLMTLKTLATVYGLWIAAAVFYWPTSRALNALWTAPSQQETYTHGYLILMISLWLVWRERQHLGTTPIRSERRALVALLILSTLWLWSWRAAIQTMNMMLLPPILFMAILTALGPNAARRLVFPISYLYFALPFWSVGNTLLQDLSANMTGILLWITGVPGFMQGNFIELPAGTIQIAGGCSGLHSFIVGLALAALYGKLFNLSAWRRFSYVALMGVISMIVNWIRIFIVAVVAYTSAMQSSLIRNHYWLGWWLFAAAFAGFLWWTERQSVALGTHRPEDRTHTRALTGSAKSSPTTALRTVGIAALSMVILIALFAGLRISLMHNYYRYYWIGWSLCIAALAVALGWAAHRRSSRGAFLSPKYATNSTTAYPTESFSGMRTSRILATLAALAILPVAAYGTDWAHANHSATVTIHWPQAPAGWQGPTPALASEWQPYYVRAGGQSLRTYRDAGGQNVQVFAVAYRVQTQHAKLLGYWNRLLGRSSALRSQTQHIVDTTSGRWIETAAIDSSGARSLIWSRYRVGSRIFVSPRLSQVWYGLAALINPPLSSLTALRAKCQPNCRAARKQLEALSHVVRPQFLPAP